MMETSGTAVHALTGETWPYPRPSLPMGSPQYAELLTMYPSGRPPRPGSLCCDEVDRDSHWHFHDMHQLMYTLEDAVEVEVEGGRHLIPRQLAAWIPAGVAHRMSLHRIRSGSIFFPADMIPTPGNRIRTVRVSALMRELMRESLRWPLDGADSLLRSTFYTTLAAFCTEWIEAETDLFLPTCDEPRLKRALDLTASNMDARLPDVCRHAGMSERSLRRHLKQAAGMTWEAYRQRSRLLHAIALLSETDVSITDIAARCGFESPSAFTRAFRLTLSETPREYRVRTRNA